MLSTHGFYSGFLLRATSNATRDLSFFCLIQRTATPKWNSGIRTCVAAHAGVKAAIRLTAICDGKLKQLAILVLFSTHLNFSITRMDNWQIADKVIKNFYRTYFYNFIHFTIYLGTILEKVISFKTIEGLGSRRILKMSGHGPSDKQNVKSGAKEK